MRSAFITTAQITAFLARWYYNNQHPSFQDKCAGSIVNSANGTGKNTRYELLHER